MLRRCVIAVATALLATGAPSASAITILTKSMEGFTTPPAKNTVGGGNLSTLYAAAADWWANVLPGPKTITIEYGWTNLNDFDASAATCGIGSPLCATPYTFFNNSGSTKWFLDDTPQYSEEFQTIASFMQVKNNKTINVGRSLMARPGTPAVGAKDLYSTALHEIGHALGFNELPNDFLTITNPPSFSGISLKIYEVGGSHLGYDASGPGPSYGNTSKGLYHAALAQNRPNGERRLPSQADILAVAEVGGFSSVRLGAIISAGFNMIWNQESFSRLGDSVINQSFPSDTSLGIGGTFGGPGGTVFVEGLKLTVGEIFIGNGFGSPGALTVSGTNSRVEISQGLHVGHGGPGKLVIDRGGRVLLSNDGSPVTVGSTVASGSLGDLRIEGAGSALVTNGNLTIGNFEAGRVIVTDSGTLSVQDVIIQGASLWNGGSSELTVSNGATVTADLISVKGGGVLSGSAGAIVGKVNVIGGTWKPGASPGTMSIIGDVNLIEGSLELEFDGIYRDEINVSGLVYVGPEFVISIYLPAFDFPSIDIADFFTGATPLFDPAFGFEDLLLFTSDVGSVGKTLEIVFGDNSATLLALYGATGVAEPGTLALLGLGLAGLAATRRRKQ